MKNNQPAEGSQEAVHQVRLPVSKSTIDLVADLIRKQRKRLGTRWRKVTPGTQAIIVLAVLRHDQRLLDMAGGNDVSASTVRRWVIEVIGLLSARAPRLDRALKKIADDGGVVVPLDGTLVRTRRRTGTENRKNYSGKDKSHGLLFLALTDENLIWISVAKPGRSSEITTARHNKLTERLREAKLGALADLGFVGLDDDPDNPVITTGRKATRNHRLTDAEKEANRLLSRERAAIEHDIANLKTRRFLSKVRMNTRHATVAVPTKDALDRVDGDARRLRPILRESLQKLATEAGLNSYEIPRDLLVETEPFTQENRLLSGVRKPLRPALTKRYGERLEALYTQLSDREAEELRTLRQTGTDQPVQAAVLRAAQALLGLEEGVVELGTRFLELGGDSLTALSFSQLLKETFHVDVPVDVVINPVNSLRQVADHIERALASEHRRPTADSVHGPDATRLDAADLRLDAFLDARTIARAERPAGPLPEARTVLLTGANGYLGRFLCLEWLERVAERGGTLVCVVRGSSAETARARFDAAFDSGDPELMERYRRSAARHLHVVAGDIGEPGLGFDEKTWQRLADTVDLIVHPAALVNHVLPYDQLFGPNVRGTAELIRLAVTSRIKQFTYLSTVAVAFGNEAAADESADIRTACGTRDLEGDYADGYAASKWAGEVLLREAYETFGLPVAVFRSNMILAHPRYRGQLNVPDVFTRLLLSLLTTGIAPGSFYARGTGDGRAHYDALPVDFTARAVTSLGDDAREGHRTYNVVNPHDDGISLDTFVDWLTAAGHPLTRVQDHAEWLDRFETALRGLPDRQKQHSLLPLLHAFTEPEQALAGSALPADRFRAAVRAAALDEEKDIPRLSPDLITKYVADLRAHRLI